MASRFPDREAAVRVRFERIAPTLDERGRRLFAANEALSFGYGGTHAIAVVSGAGLAAPADSISVELSSENGLFGERTI